MSTDRPHHLSPSFNWLNATQFFGALNDNLFKQFLIFALLVHYGEAERGTVLANVGTIFVIPFLLFMAAAGTCADRFSKRNIVVMAKCLEVAMMGVGFLAFLKGAPWLLYLALFGMSAQSAFFGPAKYGAIPELVKPEQLSKANGYIQAFTYISIIIGTGLAPFISETTDRNFAIAGISCIGVSALGLVCSFFIRKTEPAGSTDRPSLFFLGDIYRTLKEQRHDRYLMGAMAASAYFLMIAAFMQLYLIPYGMDVLGITEEQSAYLFLFAAIGIGFGAVVAGKMSGRNVEFGIVPVGAGLISIFTMALAVGPISVAWVRFFMFMIGIGTGFFIVPLQAFIQLRSPHDKLGKVLAASSFMGWVGVLIAAQLVKLFDVGLDLSPRTGFLMIGLLTLVLSVAAFKVLPDFLFRFVVLVITRICYRIKVKGIEQVPTQGPALLICNHVSWIDALVIMATQQRRVRFLMARFMTKRNRWFNWGSRLARVIPIQSGESPKKLGESIQAARDALDEGYLVCIFAEGRLSRSGMPMAFKSGYEKIVAGTDYPIIPVYIGGAWGSITSYAHGRQFSRWPVAFPYPVSLVFGAPMPSTAKAFEVRQRVLELSTEYFEDKKASRVPLETELVRNARQCWHHPALRDTLGRQLTYGETVIMALCLGDLIRKTFPVEERIGLLLPTSVGGALANLGVLFSGKVSVNLNYTASAEGLASAITQSGMTSVITTRPFLKKLGDLTLPEQVVYLEDMVKDISRGDKIKWGLAARFLPTRWLSRRDGFMADEVATIIFSSGSTGTPKGVMLSHHNILSNVEGLRVAMSPGPEDDLCSALPFFHSFGYTCTIWLPLLSGFSASYHPNPLEAAKIAKLVRESGSTVLISTPTFLLNFIRRAEAEDFATLRYVLTGAEKLKARVAESFYEKFGVRPMEGYGATELAPVAAISAPNVQVDGYTQVGFKEGSVGHPLPGIAMKVVDPDSGETLPPGKAGLLLVKGPNVMVGYLGQPEQTREAVQDGWYNTGDMAELDADGFVTITDRLSRFSKIAGEMIPHLAIEEAYQRLLGKSEQVVVVTAVPDEKKGEKLVVLYTPEAGDPEHLHSLISGSELPNLWKPGRNCYIAIDEIPVLGTGKLDLQAIKEKAQKI